MGVRLAVAVVLISMVLLTLYLGPLWLWILLLELFLVAALWEFFRLLDQYSLGGFEITAVATSVSPIVWAVFRSYVLAFLLAVPVLLLARSFWRGAAGGPILPRAGANILCFFYLGPPFLLAILLRESESATCHGHELVFILICVWLSDSAGFFVGRKIGRHKVTPRLSPNKSLEGFAAALIAPCLGAVLLHPLLLSGQPNMPAAILGSLLGAAAIGGDLFESFLKRRAEIKDSSTLIPGHGGVLDRIDSLLFALPCYYLLERALT